MLSITSSNEPLTTSDHLSSLREKTNWMFNISTVHVLWGVPFLQGILLGSEVRGKYLAWPVLTRGASAWDTFKPITGPTSCAGGP